MHIGLICPGVPGHLNPMSALGRELMRRGHRITFFGILDSEARAVSEGLPFCPIGESEYPVGVYQKQTAHLGSLSGMAALRYTLDLFQRTAVMTLRELPGALKSQQIDALLVDQTEMAAATVAQVYEIPFVTICNALPTNGEPMIPPPLHRLVLRDRSLVPTAQQSWLCLISSSRTSYLHHNRAVPSRSASAHLEGRKCVSLSPRHHFSTTPRIRLSASVSAVLFPLHRDLPY